MSTPAPQPRQLLTLEEINFERLFTGPLGYPMMVGNYRVGKVENGLQPGDYFVAMPPDIMQRGRMLLLRADHITPAREAVAYNDGERFVCNLEDCVRVEIVSYYQDNRKLSAEYGKLQLAQDGEIVVIDGITLKKLNKDPRDLAPGDFYVAERNTGWQLLEVRANDLELGCIYPVENAYAYDTRECVPVELIDII